MIHATKSQTMFTFPDPSGGGGTVPGGTKDSGSGGTGTGSGGTTTDSRFSSILHVHERHLSTEDFHEALFFEKSPKTIQRLFSGCEGCTFVQDFFCTQPHTITH